MGPSPRLATQLLGGLIRSVAADPPDLSAHFRDHLTPTERATTIRTERVRCTSLTILVLIPQALAGLLHDLGR